MKKLLFLAAVCSTMIWMNCDDCRFVDCEPNDTLVINYINADSTNLLVGNDSISFTPLLANPSQQPGVYLLGSATSNADLYVKVDETLAGFVIQLEALPPDTLKIVTEPAADDKCCDKKVNLKQVVYKNQTYDITNFSKFYIIK